MELRDKISITAMSREILTDTAGLQSLVHDRWFNLDEVAFDPERKEISLYLGDYDGRGPYDKKLLRITDVMNVAIDDKARIGTYDINRIEFASGTVRIICNVPLNLILTTGEKCIVYLTELSATMDQSDQSRVQVIPGSGMEPIIHTDAAGLVDMTREMWFDPSRLNFDRQKQEVSVPLGYRKRRHDQTLLTVTDVSDVVISGRANVGPCQVRDVEVTDASVRITSSVPLEIVLTTGDGCSIYLTDLHGPYKVWSIEIDPGEAISSFLRFLRLKKPPS